MSKCVEEEFRFVQNKKSKNQNHKPLQKTTIFNPNHNIKNETYYIDKDAVTKRLNAIKTEIKSSEFFNNIIKDLQVTLKQSNILKIQEIVCFGIGSFGTSPSPLHQLAFILQLRENFNINDCHFYDPVLQEDEKDILRDFNCNLLEENCEGKYTVERITLFYMPHCPKQLTNNLLWSNWDLKTLSNVILISNSFENLTHNTPERFLKQDAGYILRILKYTKEVPVKNCYRFNDIFNDSSIMLFPKEILIGIEQEFWLDKAEPCYGDTEMITRDIEKKLKINCR